jgi:hypothetical protein
MQPNESARQQFPTRTHPRQSQAKHSSSDPEKLLLLSLPSATIFGVPLTLWLLCRSRHFPRIAAWINGIVNDITMHQVEVFFACLCALVPLTIRSSWLACSYIRSLKERSWELRGLLSFHVLANSILIPPLLLIAPVFLCFILGRS